ncbi:MAG: hypothetical protein NT099_00300 [Candidatus Saganbacteria bacterium]|nr:hypothetical protein [Candidatus Saganbacteria bacterium]
MLTILITLTIGFLLGILALYFIMKTFGPKSLPIETSNKGAALEEARKILLDNGYAIKEKNKGATVLIHINGKAHMAPVSIDYLAEKNGKTFLVEVKNDLLSADPTETLTRRQLIEQQMSFHSPLSLVVDVVNKRVIEVSFEFPGTGSQQEKLMRIVLASFIILVVLWFFWLMIYFRMF